ncbi:hypothetical protein SAMN03097699_2833 [Flavobacteriaceae bacterium MAR_2010_188]|nr:hypothetical protein SAMN03097699_2833 [Flavobacteriaceae bacterium MAR_2010_188]
MRNYFYLLLILITTFSCKDESDNKVVEDNTVQSSASAVSKADIKTIKYTDYGLGSDAQKAVANWLQYKELDENLELVKKGDLSFLSQDQEVMMTLLQDLRINIPSAVNTKSIKARLLALETQLLMANSLLNLKNVEKSKKIDAVKMVLIAMSNFNDQMNKKFEIESNNILRRQ